MKKERENNSKNYDESCRHVCWVKNAIYQTSPEFGWFVSNQQKYIKQNTQRQKKSKKYRKVRVRERELVFEIAKQFRHNKNI